MNANEEAIPEWKLRLAQQYFNKRKNAPTAPIQINPIQAARRALDSSDEELEEEFKSFAVSPSKRTIEVEN